MELNYCYHHSDFQFSSGALEWIKETYVYPYKGKKKPISYDKYSTSTAQTKFFHKKISWEGTRALQELRDYLEEWGIQRDYLGTDIAGPDVFMFNDLNHGQKGYPHIDGYKWNPIDPSDRLPVLTRFNVVIEYDPDDTMYWWEHIVKGHSLVGPITHTVVANDGTVIKNHQHLGILGKNVDDLWNNCGKPTYEKKALYKNHQSAFLRTDCAHCISIEKAGFRLVVAIALDKTLKELYQYRGYM